MNPEVDSLRERVGRSQQKDVNQENTATTVSTSNGAGPSENNISLNRRSALEGMLCTLVSFPLFITAFVTALILQCLNWVFLFPLLLWNVRFRTISGGMILRMCQSAAVMLNPFWKCDLRRAPPVGWRPGRTILMVNHLSSMDPWVVSRFLVPWEMKWVYKKDLEKMPLFGWTVRLSYDLPIEFTKDGAGWATKIGSVANMMTRCKEYLDLNIGTVVFPEGTRSRLGRLQPFKAGFFKLALQEKVEIMPCVIHNSQEIWPLGTRITYPGTVYFSYGDPIYPTDEDTVETLKQKVMEAMIGMQMEMPGYDHQAHKPLTTFATSRGHSCMGETTP